MKTKENAEESFHIFSDFENRKEDRSTLSSCLLSTISTQYVDSSVSLAHSLSFFQAVLLSTIMRATKLCSFDEYN
jgi:hypothetical protein